MKAIFICLFLFSKLVLATTGTWREVYETDTDNNLNKWKLTYLSFEVTNLFITNILGLQNSQEKLKIIYKDDSSLLMLDKFSRERTRYYKMENEMLILCLYEDFTSCKKYESIENLPTFLTGSHPIPRVKTRVEWKIDSETFNQEFNINESSNFFPSSYQTGTVWMHRIYSNYEIASGMQYGITLLSFLEHNAPLKPRAYRVNIVLWYVVKYGASFFIYPISRMETYEPFEAGRTFELSATHAQRLINVKLSID